MIINGITYNIDPALLPMSEQEATELTAQDIAKVEDNGDTVTAVDLVAVGDEIEIKVHKYTHITRIRRICGYQSKVEHWNDAKRSELQDRFAHMEIGRTQIPNERGAK